LVGGRRLKIDRSGIELLNRPRPTQGCSSSSRRRRRRKRRRRRRRRGRRRRRRRRRRRFRRGFWDMKLKSRGAPSGTFCDLNKFHHGVVTRHTVTVRRYWKERLAYPWLLRWVPWPGGEGGIYRDYSASHNKNPVSSSI